MIAKKLVLSFSTFLIVASALTGCDRVRSAFDEKRDAAGALEEKVEKLLPGTEEPAIVVHPPDGAEPRVLSIAENASPVSFEADVIGRVSADSFGEDCYGFIGDQRSFGFDIVGDEPIETIVTLRDAGGIDATLVIDGPGGPYCNDDGADSLLPRVRHRFSAGSYDVYVGAYRKNQGAHFEALVGPAQPKLQIADCDRANEIRIGEGFQSQRIEGALEGLTRSCADAFGMECSGRVPERPGPCVVVEAPTVVEFSVAKADFDSTMVVQGATPAASQFNDDGPGGTESEIVAALPPGTYALHIGAYDPDASGSWTVEARAIDAALDDDGRLRLKPAGECRELTPGEPLSLIGTTKPELTCSALFDDEDCLGAVPIAANHCVTLREPGTLTATIQEANFDTVLYLLGDDLLLINDDAGDVGTLLSAIRSPLPAGTYQIAVGSIDSSQAGPYRLNLTVEP